MTFHVASRRALPIALAAVLGWTSPPLPAQEAEQNPPPEHFFEERVGVEVVSIDVVVVDRKGTPIQGLGRDDFELRIDGQPVEIANFYAAGRPVTVAEETEVPEAPAAEERPTVEPLEEGLHVAVFVDNFYLSVGGRNRLLRDLPSFLDRQLADGAEILIAFSDRGGLELLTSFTTDRAALLGALKKVAAKPITGQEQEVTYRRTLHSVIDLYKNCLDSPILDPCKDCWPSIVNTVEMYSFDVDRERRGTLAGLANVTSALSLLEGRKIVLYAADGMQLQPAVDLFHYLGELCPENSLSSAVTSGQMRMDGLATFQRLTARANSSRVTFYTLETSGLRTLSSSSVVFGDTGPDGQVLKPSAVNDQIRFANLQGTLFLLADDTGGKAILNANRLAEPLAKLHEELGSYYSLGYSPNHPGAGETHRVVVKVRGKHADVRYRRSFRHKGVEEQLAERTLGAFLLGAEKNPLLAEVRSGEPSPGSEGRLVVPVEVSVPYEKLTLLPYEEERLGRVTLIVAAPEKDGKMTAIRKKELTVRAPLKAASTGARLYQVGVNVELLPGHHNLAVALWDEVAAAGSYLRLEVDAVPPTGKL